MTSTCGSAPARRKARAVSYSQLVPGNTGMMTLGLATPMAGALRAGAAKVTASTVSPLPR